MEMRRGFLGMLGILVLALAVTSVIRTRGPLPEIGRMGPNFQLAGIQGQTMTLQQLRGRAVFLVFVSPSDGASQKEAVLVESMYRKYHSSIAFFSLLVDSGPNLKTDAQSFTKRAGITFPLLYGETSNVANLYRISQVPTSFWINNQGVIVNRLNGVIGQEEVKAQFASLAANSGTDDN